MIFCQLCKNKIITKYETTHYKQNIKSYKFAHVLVVFDGMADQNIIFNHQKSNRHFADFILTKNAPLRRVCYLLSPTGICNSCFGYIRFGFSILLRSAIMLNKTPRRKKLRAIIHRQSPRRTV